jgi:P4 family phage/plasmid primase-like protien
MDLNIFLATRKSEKNENITHLSFVGGRYNILNKDNKTFMELYYKSIKSNNNLFLIERTSINYRFFADIDFELDNKVNNEELIKILEVYKRVVESDNVVVSIRNFSRIHFNFPDVIVNDTKSIKLREKVITGLKEVFIGVDFNWEKIIDKAIYKNGSFRMIGSKNRKTNDVYNLYNPYTKEYPELTLDLLLKTSVRADVIKENINIEYSDNENSDNENSDNENSDDENSGQFDKVKKFVKQVNNELYPNELLQITDIKKSDRSMFLSVKNKFCPIGDKVHNRTKSNPTNIPIYILINTKGVSIRCHNDECKGKFYPENPIGLNDEMSKIFNMSVSEENGPLQKSLTKTHYDVANYIFELFKGTFMVEGTKVNDEWHEFKGVKWEKSNSLWTYLSTKVVETYKKLDVQDQIVKANVNEMIKLLKSVNYKSSIMKESSYIFSNYDRDFVKRLDENPALMCFENGVLDLSQGECVFREGRPKDYLSISTGINYKEESEIDSEKMKEVDDFLSKIFVDKELKEYALKVIASCLFGGSDEHFHIWTGVGSNGKSTLIQLIEKTLGEYACKLPISLMTNKRTGSGNASPEVIRTRGRRFISMQEPDEGDELKVGILKELTGRDKIIARELYKNSVEFMPQFKMFLCCNELPVIPSSDGGTWRRLRCLPFLSCFCENPKGDYQFKKDPKLFLKMDTWQEAFMCILVKYYRKNLEEGIKEPEEVLKYTKQYQNESDVIQSFIIYCLEDDDKAVITITEIWNSYIEWSRDNGEKPVTRSDFNKKFKKRYTEKQMNGKRGYPLSFKCIEDMDE